MKAHLTGSTLAAIALCIGTGHVHGVTLEEHFEYSDGSSLIGQDGGVGPWGGAWTLTGTSTGDAAVTTPSLTYPGLDASGNKVTIDTSDTGLIVSRSLGTSLGADDTTTYISFKAQDVSGARFFGLRLTQPDLLIGQASFGSNWTMVDNGTAATSDDDSSIESLLVVKIESVSGNDTASLWVNPDLSLTETENAADSVLDTTDIGEFNSIDLIASVTATFQNNDFIFDELTISTDTSPFASAGLMGDYNGSGQVEQGDLDLVLSNWGVDTAVSGTPDGWVNDNEGLGLIEQSELDVVLQGWGGSSAPDFHGAPVPEPASLGLFGLTMLLAGRRTRK